MFYEFETTDPFDIIHLTVAQKPMDIATLNPKVPGDLRQVIDIMIAKNKQDRVQNASVLCHVLKTIRFNSITDPENRKPIDISSLKFTGAFYIPEKLYGRDEEFSTIFGELSAVVNQAQPRSIVLVSGISGIGKTELIKEVR